MEYNISVITLLCVQVNEIPLQLRCLGQPFPSMKYGSVLFMTSGLLVLMWKTLVRGIKHPFIVKIR